MAGVMDPMGADDLYSIYTNLPAVPTHPPTQPRCFSPLREWCGTPGTCSDPTFRSLSSGPTARPHALRFYSYRMVSFPRCRLDHGDSAAVHRPLTDSAAFGISFPVRLHPRDNIDVYLYIYIYICNTPQPPYLILSPQWLDEGIHIHQSCNITYTYPPKICFKRCYHCLMGFYLSILYDCAFGCYIDTLVPLWCHMGDVSHPAPRYDESQVGRCSRLWAIDVQMPTVRCLSH